MRARLVAKALARAFLAGDFDPPGLMERGEAALGRAPRWLRPVARQFAEVFEAGTRPRWRDAVRFLLDDARVRRARFRPAGWRVAAETRMRPVAAAEEWGVPAIETEESLAEWLGVSVSELAWLADLAGRNGRCGSEPLEHYCYSVVRKRHGAVRLIEAPKARLKAIQRQMLEAILERIPAHDAAHGFVRGRSIVSFAEPHVGQAAVLRMDLRDFFPALSGARVQALFRTLGYPERVADLLGGLSTNVTPRGVWSVVADPNVRWEAALVHAHPHVPQGAPTSPAIANACAYRLDCRLSAWAAAGAARYTRYADDLAFSGGEGFGRSAEWFGAHVAAMVSEEGFAVNFRKTRLMRQGVRQHLAGVVLNERPNIGRDAYDRLKAELTNCARRGAASQNRKGEADYRSHLLGRIGFVAMVNPGKGERLRRIFEMIEWEE